MEGSSHGFSNSPALFLTKTYEMVENPSTNPIISLSPNNTSFVVWKPLDFARDLLPKYFKHNNFSSFVRQIHTYITEITKLKSCKGSVHWIAPEVVNPKSTYGPAADIWSLGCTVLEMLTRQVPYSNLEWANDVRSQAQQRCSSNPTNVAINGDPSHPIS